MDDDRRDGEHPPHVNGQPDGTYAYRVAALFSERGFGRLLQGPVGNVVDITVQR